MFYEVSVNLVGALAFLFILWRRLKEDYASGIVFSTGFLVLLGLVIGRLITTFFAQEWWFWFEAFGMVSGLAFSIFRFKMKIFEVVDASISAVFPWLLLIFLFDSVKAKSIYSLGGFFVLLALYLLYHFLNSSYKKFSWYASGRVGFSSLAVIGIMFVLRMITSFLLIDMLSFVGKFDAIISGIVSFIAFLGLFHLARQV